jgi:hypothetical protein
MKLTTAAAISCAVVVLATAIGEAWAGGRGGSSRGSSGARPSHSGQRHHGHTRVVVGGSFFYGPMYYPYYPVPYYPPVPEYVPAEPPVVYIEQGQDPDSQVWYYCESARAYYPYAGECAEGWQRVVPDIPPQTPSG